MNIQEFKAEFDGHLEKFLLDKIKQSPAKNKIYSEALKHALKISMSGGKRIYETYLREGKARNIAMQIFSGGTTAPSKAIDYVCSLPNIESILFGSSSKENIIQTVDLINQHDLVRV